MSDNEHETEIMVKSPAETPDSANIELPHTPVQPASSIGSGTSPASSVLSSESTERLIKSLSMGRLAQKPLEPQSVPHGMNGGEGVHLGKVTNASVLAEADALPRSEKKPIKFTVRKVSRDTIKIPDGSSAKANSPREYAYGNLPENRGKVHERKASDKASQLQHSQAKYDSYTARIEKISKEIDFLTNLLPPFNVEIDYATRTKITRAIERLQMKKDEVEKKKYSIGITISRLWREHDENEIWVRSVSKQ